MLIGEELPIFPSLVGLALVPTMKIPLKIVWAPERDGVIDADEMMALVPDFTKFLLMRQHLSLFSIFHHLTFVPTMNQS